MTETMTVQAVAVDGEGREQPTGPAQYLSQITPRKEVGWTSYSGLTLHRACPQAWSYRHLFRLVKPEEDSAAPHLKYGNWWHALRAADSIERGRAEGTLKYAPDNLAVGDEVTIAVRSHTESNCTTKRCKEPDHWEDNLDLVETVFAACEQWTDALPEDHAATWKDKMGGYPSTMLRDLDNRYRARFAEERRDEQPIGVEVKWTRQLPGSDTVLIGYTDEVYYDIRRGMVVVRDHKSTAKLGMNSAGDDMLDSQLHLNVWGLADRIKEWEVPPPSAISYERVLSTAPSQPKLTQAGKLSKQVTRFDLQTYMAFCESEEAIAKEYKPEDAVIERITAPAYVATWFQRTLTPMNRNIAKVHLQAAVDSNLDANRSIDRVQRRGDAPRNMTGDACKWCDYAKLCRAQMLSGNDGEFLLAEYGLKAREGGSRR